MNKKTILTMSLVLVSLLFVEAIWASDETDRRPIQAHEKIDIYKKKNTFGSSDRVHSDNFESDKESFPSRIRKYFSRQLMGMKKKMPFAGNQIQILREEDQKFKYVKINVQEAEKKNIDIKVSNGMITIKGHMGSSNSREKGQKVFFRSYSQFSQSFNVPHGVLEKEVLIETQDEGIVLKFPKEAA